MNPSIFLAGVMQGSHTAAVVHSQAYREQILELLGRYLPQARIYDPWAAHGDSLNYEPCRAREVFFGHVEMCRQVDAVLAFLPEASMGTAIEIWAAHQAGRAVLTVSPLTHNWVVRFLSDAVYRDLVALEAALASGEFARQITERTRRRLAQPGSSNWP